MKVIKAGHEYNLYNFEKCPNPAGYQAIVFVEMDQDNTYHDGTTNEEMVEVLLNRMQYLNHKFPCNDNVKIIGCLETISECLEHRTKLREQQGVEGKHQAHQD